MKPQTHRVDNQHIIFYMYVDSQLEFDLQFSLTSFIKIAMNCSSACPIAARGRFVGIFPCFDDLLEWQRGGKQCIFYAVNISYN